MTKKILVGLLLLAVLLAGAGVWLFVKRPLALLAWTGRQSLTGAGLSRASWETPSGRQTGFKGGSGPLLVLLHGAGDQAGTWSRVAPGLLPGRTVVALDLAGHGGSEPGQGPISVGAILAAAEAVVARESAGKPATLVGNSLGAWVAFLLAERRPELVGRIVAIDGGPIRGANAAAIVLPRDRDEARRSVAQTRDPGSLKVPDHVLDDIVRQAQSGPLARVAATSGEMERYLLDGRLGSLKAAVSIVWGESDRLVPVDYARRMQAGLPGATLTTLPRCGHVPQVECPAALAGALKGALAGGAGPSP